MWGVAAGWRGTGHAALENYCRRTLPDADSHNVIADWAGRETPRGDRYRLRPSRFMGPLRRAAIDDGAGVASAMGAVAPAAVAGIATRAAPSVSSVG